MPQREGLLAEAQELFEQYREIATQTPTPEDLHDVGMVLGNAMEALETAPAQEAMEHAAAQIQAAREMLARVRTALDR